MVQSDVVRAPAPPPLSEAAHGLLRWVSCHNPFYVLSAGLFLAGLWLSFQAQAGTAETSMLMGGLAGYTLLLAATALVLVRFARDWEDLRTVLLLVVLMFLATSVTFDEVLILNPLRGYLCNLGGLAFTVLVSEAIFHGIRLKLPALYRLPYYLILALFFLYPLGLSHFADQPHSEALLWGLFGFASAAGLVALSLLPAIRRGPPYVQDNGSPWSWPLYPWALFGLLGLAVPARAWMLCWSMHLLPARDWDNLVFGPYFLLPFALAVDVLLIEFALVTRRRVMHVLALAAPLALVGLALVGHRHDDVYQEFLGLFISRLGCNPLFLAVVAAAVLYAYAAIRGMPLATEALAGALVALAFVSPLGVEWHRPEPWHSLPILSAVVLQIGLLFWRRELWRFILATVIVSWWLGRVAWWSYTGLRTIVVGIDHIALSLALFALAVTISLAKAGLLRRWAAACGAWKPALESAADGKPAQAQSDAGPPRET
jgi:hypothetical protein